MKISRLVPALLAFACHFAADEMEAAKPHVRKAIDELPADLRSGDPIGAFVTTAKNAYEAMRADTALQPSLTGLFGAVAAALHGG